MDSATRLNAADEGYGSCAHVEPRAGRAVTSHCGASTRAGMHAKHSGRTWNAYKALGKDLERMERMQSIRAGLERMQSTRTELRMHAKHLGRTWNACKALGQNFECMKALLAHMGKARVQGTLTRLANRCGVVVRFCVQIASSTGTLVIRSIFCSTQPVDHHESVVIRVGLFRSKGSSSATYSHAVK
eukprot:6518921-Prymnesium_polylepis.3